MSTSSESIPVEEENQPCASASKQPEIYITHVYTTNSDASDSSPVKLSAAAKAVMLQQELQQQQQQAKQKEGSTGIIRRSCRQRKRPRYFPPLEVRIPAARRRQQKASSPPVRTSLFFLCSPSLPPPPKYRIEKKNLRNEEDLTKFIKKKRVNVSSLTYFSFFAALGKGSARRAGIY